MHFEKNEDIKWPIQFLKLTDRFIRVSPNEMAKMRVNSVGTLIQVVAHC